MHGTRRIRVEIDAESYEALRYVALLRGQPVGATISRMLAIHATTLAEESNEVRVHLLAWHKAAAARPQLLTDNPVEGVPC